MAEDKKDQSTPQETSDEDQTKGGQASYQSEDDTLSVDDDTSDDEMLKS